MATKKGIDIPSIEKQKRHLEKLPAKEPATKPIADVLEELKPLIATAMERGYSQEEILAMATERGIPVKAYQIKALFKKQK